MCLPHCELSSMLLDLSLSFCCCQVLCHPAFVSVSVLVFRMFLSNCCNYCIRVDLTILMIGHKYSSDDIRYSIYNINYSVEVTGVVQGDVLLVCYVADVASKLQIHSLATGSKQRNIPLPGIGSITSFGGRREDSEFFFSFSSFTEPGATYRSVAGHSADCCTLCAYCLSWNVWRTCSGLTALPYNNITFRHATAPAASNDTTWVIVLSKWVHCQAHTHTL